MVEKVKDWCTYEFNGAVKHGANAYNAMTRCYGVVMFISNELLCYDTPDGKELTTWWDDEMLPRFRELY